MKRVALIAAGIIGVIGTALLIGKKQKKDDPSFTEIGDAIKELDKEVNEEK